MTSKVWKISESIATDKVRLPRFTFVFSSSPAYSMQHSLIQATVSRFKKSENTNYDMERYIQNFADNEVIKNVCAALKDFRNNDAKTNYYVSRFLHRLFLSNDGQFRGYLYHITVLANICTILDDPIISKSSQHKYTINVLTIILKSFIEHSKENKVVFLEMLLWRNRGENLRMIDHYGGTQSHRNKKKKKPKKKMQYSDSDSDDENEFLGDTSDEGSADGNAWMRAKYNRRVTRSRSKLQRTWTTEEDDHIRKVYPSVADMGHKWLQISLDGIFAGKEVTPAQIKERAEQIGLVAKKVKKTAALPQKKRLSERRRSARSSARNVPLPSWRPRMDNLKNSMARLLAGLKSQKRLDKTSSMVPQVVYASMIEWVSEVLWRGARAHRSANITTDTYFVPVTPEQCAFFEHKNFQALLRSCLCMPPLHNCLFWKLPYDANSSLVERISKYLRTKTNGMKSGAHNPEDILPKRRPKRKTSRKKGKSALKMLTSLRKVLCDDFGFDTVENIISTPRLKILSKVLPRTHEELESIIGEDDARRYGDDILQTIEEYHDQRLDDTSGGNSAKKKARTRIIPKALEEDEDSDDDILGIQEPSPQSPSVQTSGGTETPSKPAAPMIIMSSDSDSEDDM